MKYLCLLVLCLLNLNAYSQVIDIPDANLLSALIEEGVDTNGDGLIQQQEAEQVEVLNLSQKEISSIEGISAFVNLTQLDFSRNVIEGNLEISLPQLKFLDISNNQFNAVNFSGSVELESLEISTVYSLTELDITPLTKLKTLNASFCDLKNFSSSGLQFLETVVLNSNRNLESFSLKNSPKVININVENCKLSGLDLENIPSLKKILARDNHVHVLELKDFQNLEEIDFHLNQMETLQLENLPSLISVIASANALQSVGFNNTPLLESINLGGNPLSNISLENLPNIKSLLLGNNQFESIDLNHLKSLENLTLVGNNLTSITLESMPELTNLTLDKNEISNLVLVDLPSLEDLNISNNNFHEISLSLLPSLIRLQSDNNPLESLELLDLPNLKIVSSLGGQLQSFTTLNLPSLEELNLLKNELVELHLADLPSLIEVNLFSNKLESLTFSNLPNLETLECVDNKLTYLDFMSLPSLNKLTLSGNLFVELDFSQKSLLVPLGDIPLLEYLNIKNGVNDGGYYSIRSAPNLKYICMDEGDRGDLSSNLAQAGLEVILSTDCQFSGNGRYQLLGRSRFDIEKDGCTIDDPAFGGLKLLLQNESGEDCIISNQEGFFGISLSDSVQTITPLVDQNLYTVDPVKVEVNFNHLGSNSFTQLFCVSPKIEFNDVEVKLIPIDQARPGFDTEYKISVKNNGVTPASGQVTFTYDAKLTEFIAASPNESSFNQGTIIFNYTDIAPNAKESYQIILKLNTPTEECPLSGGEELKFNVYSETNVPDLNPLNNSFALCQEVVNSFDPNDKICMEGSVITPEQVNDYLHYMIRFENTGTASAVNIRVEDAIDLARFDISTLEIIEASHLMTTLIHDENVVDFIFEDIQLPFDDANNDGFVVFKIKGLSTLQVGQVITNKSSIFFDFNAPIITNTAETKILRDDDNDGFFEDVDCDDNNSDINPDIAEIAYNGIDDDCDPMTLDDDLDGDGFALADDCDDANSDINPSTAEIAYNGIDDDCDPMTLDDDLDGDGFALADDCDDENIDINPNTAEIAYNGLDDDCDPMTADDDLDGDGFVLADDCDDENSDINPNTAEIAYNGLDDDCDPMTLDDDLDGDGFVLAEDCDDENSDINPDSEEIANNGIDEDCDGEDLVNTSTQSLGVEQIDFYPNPVSEFLNIESTSEITVKLWTQNGVLIIDEIFPSGKHQLNLNNFVPGLYLIQFEGENISFSEYLFID